MALKKILSLIRSIKLKKESKEEIEQKMMRDYLSNKIKDLPLMYCDNPECNLPITENFLAYDRTLETIYHSGCELCAGIYRTTKPEICFSPTECISLREAGRLYLEKKLSQSRFFDDLEKTLAESG